MGEFQKAHSLLCSKAPESHEIVGSYTTKVFMQDSNFVINV